MNTKFLNLFSKLSPRLIKELWPLIFGRIANRFTYQLKLMNFWIALKEGHSLLQKLGNDTSNWPNINSCSILLYFQQQLWCPIPKSYNFSSNRLIRFFYIINISTKLSSQSEIGNFQYSLTIQQQIGKFQIPMNQILRMSIADLEYNI